MIETKPPVFTEHVDLVVIVLRIRFVVAIDHVARVPYAQFEKYRFFSEFFFDHRRVQDGHEQKEFLVFAIRRL